MRVVAVSPLIGGRAVKGPLDRMLLRMAGGTSPAHVAGCYPGLIDALVIDDADSPAASDVPLVVSATLIGDRDAARAGAFDGEVRRDGGLDGHGIATSPSISTPGAEKDTTRSPGVLLSSSRVTSGRA